MVIYINYECFSRINFNRIRILDMEKEKISLIRRYHYKRVKEKDKKIYCTRV